MKILYSSKVSELVKEVKVYPCSSKIRINTSGPSAQYFNRIADQDGNQILFCSDKFFYTVGDWVKSNNTFPIDSDKVVALYNAIVHIEGLTEKALTNSGVKDTKLRPTYTNGDTAWLKIAQDFVAFDWKGEKKLKLDDLSTGHYQLIIRASSVYNGRHGDTEYRRSVLFRISQLRFSPVDTAINKFLFNPYEPVSDMDQSVQIPLVSITETGEVEVWTGDSQCLPIACEDDNGPGPSKRARTMTEPTEEEENDENVMETSSKDKKKKKNKKKNPFVTG